MLPMRRRSRAWRVRSGSTRDQSALPAASYAAMAQHRLPVARQSAPHVRRVSTPLVVRHVRRAVSASTATRQRRRARRVPLAGLTPRAVRASVRRATLGSTRPVGRRRVRTVPRGGTVVRQRARARAAVPGRTAPPVVCRRALHALWGSTTRRRASRRARRALLASSVPAATCRVRRVAVVGTRLLRWECVPRVRLVSTAAVVHRHARRVLLAQRRTRPHRPAVLAVRQGSTRRCRDRHCAVCAGWVSTRREGRRRVSRVRLASSATRRRQDRAARAA